jgi:threonine dehydratase
MSVELSDIEQAARRLDGNHIVTPVLNVPELDERLEVRVYFKAECLQVTGSFKFRGAYNAISQIASCREAGHVVAFSSGNHAQGVAAAARLCGLGATIIMPHDAPEIKRANTKALGAEVIGYDRYNQDREALAIEVLARSGGVLVRPFDDERVIAGQGTVGLELAQTLKARGVSLDAVLVPCGGGGLAAGVGLAFAGLSPATKMIGVEPQGFDDHARSLADGQRVPHDGANTICDALMVPMPGEITFKINRHLLSDVVVVNDDEVRRAMAYAAQKLKCVVEPGGAVGLAAVLSGRYEARGKSIGIVLSGGNVDLNILCEILQIRF